MRKYKIPTFRIQLVKEGEMEPLRFSGPHDVVKYAQGYAMSDREIFVSLHLDSKNRVVGQEVVSVGTLNQAVVHAREIYKSAILANSAAIIISHNHPSGNVECSKEDDQLTRRMASAGRLLGIALLDHVIISPNGNWFSYQEKKPEMLKGEVRYEL